MSKLKPLPRRTFLKGMGTAVALPLLESMIPSRSYAQGQGAKRLAILFLPNGVNREQFYPGQTGTNYTLPSSLSSLANLRQDFLFISGLANPSADYTPQDGGGDHARSAGTFLTNVRVNKSESNVRAARSFDQIVADTLGQGTAFRSLELGGEGGSSAGGCDSGYSCAYTRNISWASATTPNPKEINPRLVFDRLFATGGQATDEQLARRRLYQKSILDFVRNDTQRLLAKVGSADKQKLDEYLTRVRELEQRVENGSDITSCQSGNPPTNSPAGYDQRVKLVLDLMVLAFQCDLTRVITFMFANEGSNQNFPFIGINEGHHDLSHHAGNGDKKAKLAAINKWQVSQYAYFIEKLKSSSEGGSNILDQSFVILGGGIEDGDTHNHHDLPILLAGRGGGNITLGQHIRHQEKPLANLYLALASRLGVNLTKHGDSTGNLF